MEGLSHEAASLAGHLKLGKLICLYDDNEVTIDGKTHLTFSENVAARFEALGWHVQTIQDGDHDLEGISRAIDNARQETEKPSLIVVKTTIAYGAPTKQASHTSHGAPLGKDEIKLLKEGYAWPTTKEFHVPQEAREEFEKAIPEGKKVEDQWNALYKEYGQKHPDLAKQWQAFLKREYPKGWENALPVFRPEDGPMASRSASGKTINLLADLLPNLLSGSADLSDSVNTTIKGALPLSAENPTGRNVHYGVREHAMAAMVNGMVVHGGVIPVCGTFLIFSDYMKPSIRLAALMGLPAIYLFSHDSIGLGEDGPTHQPVEQLATLRAVPNLVTLRPADANETSGAWRQALERKTGPTAIVLTRQKLPIFQETVKNSDENVRRGAYILKKESHKSRCDLILIATGSEVELAMKAQEALENNKIKTRVVSMPSWELFQKQAKSYQDKILPRTVTKRLVIEAGARNGWDTYAGWEGDVICLDRFGASAPGKVVMEKLGFSVKNVVQRAQKVLKKRK